VNFKLDENLGPTIQEFFVRGGHDCRTVREQNLGGEVDERVLKAAVSEGRILVTMDHEFSLARDLLRDTGGGLGPRDMPDDPGA
jgi:predicted nuclease of predicted toxin-antitoxin system